jgi:O-antigen ligase
VRGVHYADFLFILYFITFGLRNLKRVTNFQHPLNFAFGLIALSALGIISTIVNFEIISDYFEALRLTLLAIFFLFVTFWSSILGAKYILRIYMIGLLVSAIVNLYFTFNNPVRLLGGLPMLLGQNGPGGSVGFLMFLAAWQSLLTSKFKDKVFIVFYILVNAFLLIISYSKLGAIMGALGIMSFVVIQFAKTTVQIRRNTIFGLIVVVFAFSTWLQTTYYGDSFKQSVLIIYDHKIGNDGSGLYDSGDKERFYYYLAVGEILLANPLFGVGYNGFFSAIQSTSAHASGEMSEEDIELNANPHNAFLYYISANGILGWIIVVFLFGLFLMTFYKLFKPHGLLGLILFCCIFCAALIHCNTLIGFFNTTIMYIPLGVAYSLNVKRKHESLR